MAAQVQVRRRRGSHEGGGGPGFLLQPPQPGPRFPPGPPPPPPPPPRPPARGTGRRPGAARPGPIPPPPPARPWSRRAPGRAPPAAPRREGGTLPNPRRRVVEQTPQHRGGHGAPAQELRRDASHARVVGAERPDQERHRPGIGDGTSQRVLRSLDAGGGVAEAPQPGGIDRKSTRLNSSHLVISY